MRHDFSHYFSGSRLTRLPLYKAAAAVCCAGLLLISTGTGIAYAAATALSPEPVAAPVASPSPTATATAEPTASPSPTPTPDIPLTLIATVVQQDLGLEVLMPAPQPEEEQDPEASPEASATASPSPAADADKGEKEDLVPAMGVEFVAVVADEEGNAEEYPVDPDTATVLIEELDPGDYTVSLAPAEGYQMPEEQTVTVEKKKEYKVDIEKIEEEIVQADEVNEAAEDNSYGNAGSVGAGSGSGATTTTDTVSYADPSKTEIPVVAQVYALSGNVNEAGYVYYADGTVSPYKAVADAANRYIVSLSLDKTAQNLSDSSSSQAASASGQALSYWYAPLAGILREDAASNSVPTSDSAADPTAEPAPTETPVPTATPVPAATPAPTETPVPTQTPAPTETPVPSETPVASPTAEPSASPTATPSVTASPSPSASASPTPTPAPTPALAESIVLFDTTTNSLVPNSQFRLTASEMQVGTTVQYTGWQTLDGKQYYYDPATHKPVTGVQIISGEMYTFGADGALGMNRKGIDVSKYQGTIDWNQVKADGVEFAIIRVGYRGYGTGALVEDSQFKNNIKGATAAGVKVGLYFYSQAINEQEAVDEAAMVLALCKGYPISYPIFFDTEKVAGATGRADNISAAQRTANAVGFCNAIQSAGYTAGVYSYRDWFYYNLNFANVQKYKIWIAQYRATLDFKYRYDIWQYTSSGSVKGINGRVDMNIGY